MKKAVMEDRPMAAIGVTPSIVTLPPEIDAINAGKVEGDLSAACVHGASVVIADLSDTTFADSSALRALVRTDQLAARRGVEFRLVVTSAPVLRVLELTGLGEVLRLYPSIDAATAR